MDNPQAGHELWVDYVKKYSKDYKNFRQNAEEFTNIDSWSKVCYD